MRRRRKEKKNRKGFPIGSSMMIDKGSTFVRFAFHRHRSRSKDLRNAFILRFYRERSCTAYQQDTVIMREDE